MARKRSPPKALAQAIYHMDRSILAMEEFLYGVGRISPELKSALTPSLWEGLTLGLTLCHYWATMIGEFPPSLGRCPIVENYIRTVGGGEVSHERRDGTEAGQ